MPFNAARGTLHTCEVVPDGMYLITGVRQCLETLSHNVLESAAAFGRGRQFAASSECTSRLIRSEEATSWQTCSEAQPVVLVCKMILHFLLFEASKLPSFHDP